MTTQVELPRYKCHKIVQAAKITEISDASSTGRKLFFGEINGRTEATNDWLEKHKPGIGGYFVVYEDGYESYSPAEAFESGYTKI